MLSLIVITDENQGIGKNNKLLCHCPADLKHFKEVTWGKPVIMGRKTFESIGKILPGRLNVIVSRELKSIAGALLVSSLEEAFRQTASFPEVFVIGGGDLFRQALPHAEKIYLTRIHYQFDADVFFPKLSKSEWQEKKLKVQMSNEANPYDLTFYEYLRKKAVHNI